MSDNSAGFGDDKNRNVPILMSPGSYVLSARRSIGRATSVDVATLSSVSTNVAHHSFSSTRSCKRQHSTVSGSRSVHGSPAGKDSPRNSLGARRLSPLKGRLERPKRSSNSPGRLATQPSGGSAIKTSAPARESGWTSPSPVDDQQSGVCGRPSSDRMAICSSVGPPPTDENRRPQAKSQHESEPENGEPEPAAGGTESPALLRSPETYPITEDQLTSEVRKIYVGLAMVEKKAIELYQQHAESGEPLSRAQWQALISLHQTLLQEHHDFYLASMHPSASSVVRRLAEKYSMPARMWRYGIHSFLEMLRRRLPDSLEYMTTFIFIAYSMLTLILETVPRFEKTWIECLGDLARYRMALEEVDLHERELWAGIARYWYNKAADRAPGLGRIQHHLAVLARPDIALQLFHYTKSLISVHMFPTARDSILLLFKSLLDNPRSNSDSVVTAFVRAHGQLFSRRASDEFVMLVNYFLSALEKHIGRMGAAFRLQGVYIMSCNFAAVFEYGHADAVLPAAFAKPTESTKPHICQSASERWTPTSRLMEIEADLLTSRNSPRFLFISSSYFAFQTFAVVLDQIGDKNVYPTVHVTLAFIWCLSFKRDYIKHIETVIPWTAIALFLNTMIRGDTDVSVIQSEQFPVSDTWKQVPEDFCLRGQAWTGPYYPPGFFEPPPTEEDGRWIEAPSLNIARASRCLWLGGRIAASKCWLVYDPESRKFSPTLFAVELEKCARRFYPFSTLPSQS